MKPFKSLVPIAGWILRIALGALLYLRFWNTLTHLNFTNITHLIILGIAVAFVLLVVGGFSSNSSMTVVSGLCLLGLFIGLTVVNGYSLNTILKNIQPMAIGFYFLAAGNR